jgi:hypothetical protein
MAHVIGASAEGFANLDERPRYYYGLRRDEEGTLWLGKADLKDPNDNVRLYAQPLTRDGGLSPIPFHEFFNQRELYDTDATNPEEALYYQQWRIDKVKISYYIDDNGEFVASVGADRTYPTDV